MEEEQLAVSNKRQRGTGHGIMDRLESLWHKKFEARSNFLEVILVEQYDY